MSQSSQDMPWVHNGHRADQAARLRDSTYNNVLKGSQWEALLLACLTPEQLRRREAIIAYHLKHDRHMSRKELNALGCT